MQGQPPAMLPARDAHAQGVPQSGVLRAAQGGWSRFCFAKSLLAHASWLVTILLKQNRCSPLQPEVQRKSRKHAAGGLRNWSSGTRGAFHTPVFVQGKISLDENAPKFSF
jgi:hypothetical protein